MFERWDLRRVSSSGGAPQKLSDIDSPNLPDVRSDGRILIVQANSEVEAFDPRDGNIERLGTLPAKALWGMVLWSPDGHSVGYARDPAFADDPNAGLWVYDFKNPPRQIFRGWVIWLARNERDEIYLLQGQPDLTSVVWKVNWNGQGLTRTPASIADLYDSNYFHTGVVNQFAASPDGRYLAFQIDQVLEENIGMIENPH